MDQNELSLEPHRLGVSYGASKMISKPMVFLAQTVHLSCANADTMSKQTENEIPHDPLQLGVPSGASKMISEPMVRLAQTVHLTCTGTSIISKRTEKIFHLTQVT